MKRILVLGGSPKGDESVTMEHVRFLENNLKEGEFIYTQPGLRIRKLEKDEKSFGELMGEVESADVILLAMPVYYTLIPSGFKRFIELINERGKASFFKGKRISALMTSIQFYDHTALNYLQAVCEDWDCRWSAPLSVNMHDIFRKKSRTLLLEFGRRLLGDEDFSQSCRRYPPLPDPIPWNYIPDLTKKISTERKKIVLITDGTEELSTLGAMSAKAKSLLGGEVKCYRLDELMKGTCLGCLRCGFDNHCAWEGKDGYIEAFKEWMEADILIMAGTMKDRYLSSVWKSAFDRSFWRTHQSSFPGKQILWLVSGPLSHVQNLVEILHTYGELQEADHTRIISDEIRKSEELDAQIEGDLKKILRTPPYDAVRPVTFRRVGGYKVFRDEIFGGLKVIFRKDHKTYRRTGIYDFPHRHPLKQLAVFLGYLLTGFRGVQKIMTKGMKSYMIKGYKTLYR